MHGDGGFRHQVHRLMGREQRKFLQSHADQNVRNRLFEFPFQFACGFVVRSHLRSSNMISTANPISVPRLHFGIVVSSTWPDVVQVGT
jgi:hypothetical protein